MVRIMMRYESRNATEFLKFLTMEDEEGILDRKSKMEPINHKFIETGQIQLESNPMIDAIHTFHQQVAETIQLPETHCVSCGAQDIGTVIKDNKCSHCSVKNGEKFTAANNMLPGPLPPALQNLLPAEVAAISKILPIISVYRVGTSSRMKGYTISFPQNVSDIVNRLPRTPQNLSIVYIRTPAASGRVLKVRKWKVLWALQYLKKYNPHYEDVEIDEDLLNQHYSDDGAVDLPGYTLNDTAAAAALNAEPDDPEADEAELDEQGDTVILAETMRLIDDGQSTPQADLVLQDVQAQINAASEEADGRTEANPLPWAAQGDPVSEMTDGFWAMAFPDKFPDGKGVFVSGPKYKISRQEWVQHLMRHHSNRFAACKRFTFFTFAFLQKYTSFQLGRLFANQNRLYTREDLVERLNQNDPESLRQLTRDIQRFTKKIPGSKEYMKQFSKRAGAVVDMYRHFTDDAENFNVFYTISSADLHDPYFYNMFEEGRAHLKKTLVKHLNEIPPNANQDQYITTGEDYLWRRNFLEAHAHHYDIYYRKLLDLLLKIVIYPVLGAKDHIIRYEYQSRGAIHAHILLAVPMGIDLASKKNMLLVDNLEEQQRVEQELFANEEQAALAVNDLPEDSTAAQRAIHHRLALLKEVGLRLGICERHPSDSRHDWFVQDGGTLTTPPTSSTLRQLFDEALQQVQIHIVNLVNKVGIHRCVATYCCRPRRNDPDNRACRFRFPKPLVGFHHVSDEESNGSGGTRRSPPPHACGVVNCLPENPGNMMLQMVRNHKRVVSYNPWLLMAWPCNQEMHFISEPKSVKDYCSKYIAKEQDTSNAGINFQEEVLTRVEQCTDAVKTLQSLVRLSTQHHDYSLAEVHLHISNVPAMVYSREFVMVNVIDSTRQLDLDANATYMYVQNLADTFDRRTETPGFIQLKQLYEEDMANSEAERRVWVKHPDDYTMYEYGSMFDRKWNPLKKFKAVLSIPQYNSRPNKATKPDKFREFALTMLRLHTVKPQLLAQLKDLPNDELEQLGDAEFRQPTAKQWLYDLWTGVENPHQNDEVIPFFAPIEEPQRDVNDLGFDAQPLQDDIDEDGDLYTNTDIVTTNFDRDAHRLELCSEWTLRTGHEFRQTVGMDDQLQQDDPALLFNELNIEQQHAVSIMKQLALNIATSIHSSTGDRRKCPDGLQFFFELCGAAGTGKTAALLRFKVDLASSMEMQAPSLAVGKFLMFSAATGCAAKLLPHPHSTLHKLVNLPIGLSHRRAMPQLQPATLKTLQDQLDQLQVLVIDEKSFLGCRMLQMIDDRLKQIKCDKRPFGGVSVILVGDFKQLAPVNDIALFRRDNPTMAGFQTEGRKVYQQNFKHCIFLTENQRQNSDTDMKNVLETFVGGAFHEEQWNILSRRNLHKLPNEEKEMFKSQAVKLCSIKRNFRDYNVQKVRELNQPIVLIQSVNLPTSGKKFEESDAGGLPREIILCKGMRVMLTANINIACSLSNGSQGTVVGIIYAANSEPTDFPEVLVQFDTYTGSSFLQDVPGVYPVGVIERTWKTRGVEYSRRMLPLVPGYAFSIHKSQGQTLQRVIIDLGDKEFASGLTYTALTRVRRLDHLAFDPMPDLNRIKRVVTSVAFKRQIEDDAIKKAAHETTVNNVELLQSVAPVNS